MLQINDLSYRINGRILFDKLKLSLFKDQKMGLVGRNGTGKSTLIRLISDDLSADTGEIHIQKNIRVSITQQERPTGEMSVFDYVLNADTERAHLLKQSETCKDPLKITDIHNRLSDIDAYSAPKRAERLLNGLGFEKEKQTLSLSSLSGGWAMRAALGATLFSRPDLLILDEPTNHLDLEGSLWLKSYLKAFRGTLLLISHDRSLLDHCVNLIAYLAHHKIQIHTGNYTQFEKKLAETQEKQLKLKAKQEDEKRKLQQFVDRFKAKASKASQAQSRIKRLNKMQTIATLVENPIAPFVFPAAKRMIAPPLFSLENINIGYQEDTPILKDLNLRIDANDRIGILGKNGAGKSTLAKLLCQKLTPFSGKFSFHKKIQIGWFTQHQTESLHPDMTAYDYIKASMPDHSEAQRRACLAQFGFTKSLSDTKTGHLSGGEKTRLLLNLIALPGLHMMILDEPTNHLDMDSRFELANCLNDFSGSVILISHDEHLINMTIDRLWLVADQTVTPFEGDLSDYQKALLKQEEAPRSLQQTPSQSISKSRQRQLKAQRRTQFSQLKKEILHLETRLTHSQEKLALIDQTLSDPETYQNIEKTKILTQERLSLVHEIEKLESLWLTKTEDYENKLKQNS